MYRQREEADRTMKEFLQLLPGIGCVLFIIAIIVGIIWFCTKVLPETDDDDLV